MNFLLPDGKRYDSHPMKVKQKKKKRFFFLRYYPSFSSAQILSTSNSTVGHQLLESRGLNYGDRFFWISIGALFGFVLVFNIGFTLALTFLKRKCFVIFSFLISKIVSTELHYLTWFQLLGRLLGLSFRGRSIFNNKVSSRTPMEEGKGKLTIERRQKARIKKVELPFTKQYYT